MIQRCPGHLEGGQTMKVIMIRLGTGSDTIRDRVVRRRGRTLETDQRHLQVHCLVRLGYTHLH